MGFRSHYVNYRLFERGKARVYDSSFEKRSSFSAAESDAQEREVGAWRCRNVDSETASPTPTRTPTRTPTEGSSGGSGQLSVARIHEDAQGGRPRERERRVRGLREHRRRRAGSLELGEVSDEADHTYTVPDGFTLDTGATVTLYSGSGQDPESELYWGSDAAIWNNEGDTVYVHTNDGEQVIAYEY